jgi:hypothetical protein
VKPITNVHVHRNSPFAPEYSLGWEFDGARYHVWVSTDGRFDVRPELFKNPTVRWENRLQTERPEGFFETRKLSLAIAKNKAMADDAMAQAVAGNMFAAADRKLTIEEQNRKAKARDAYLQTLAKEAAPDMLKVLQAIAEFWKDEQRAFPLDPGALLFEDGDLTIADAVRNAIKTATTGPAKEGQ